MMTRRSEVLTLVTSNRSKMPWESMSSSRSEVQAADNLDQVLTLVTSNRSKMPWESMSSSGSKAQAADHLEQVLASYIKSG